MGVVITYSQPLDTSAFSNWERVKSPGNNDVLFPKDFLNTNVVVGDNSATSGIGGTYRFRVVGNTINEYNNFTLIVSEDPNNPGNDIGGLFLIDTTTNEQISFDIDAATKDVRMRYEDTVNNIINTIIVGNSQIEHKTNNNSTGKEVTITQDENSLEIIARENTSNRRTVITQDNTSYTIEFRDVQNYSILHNISGIDYNFGTGPVFKINNVTAKPSVLTIFLSAYDDDAAAGVGGLVAGDMYQTSGAGAAPLNVPGIVMVKQ